MGASGVVGVCSEKGWGWTCVEDTSGVKEAAKAIGQRVAAVQGARCC